MFLKITLPDSKPAIQAEGMVLWSKHATVGLGLKRIYHEVGIEFVNIADEDRQRIAAYVEGQPK